MRHALAPMVAIILAAGLVGRAAAQTPGEIDCLIEPHVVVTVSTATEGVVESVTVDRGDLVKEGQVLVTLRSEVEKASVAVARARAELANKRLAELELQRAAAELSQRIIRSPINGVVVERMLSPGEFAKQSPVLKLAQIDPLRVEVFAPVTMLGKVRVGMRADILPASPVNGSHVGRVTVVDRVVHAASGTFGVRLELRNPGYKLPAGVKCRLRFLND
jgi:multidrug efflux pump subunit AcrA (membrane-fusion protein)